jgi:predicted transcriptional regulator
MSVGNRRSELEIIRDILRTSGGRTTSLRYAVNLSHSQMQKYLAFLDRSSLICLERQGSRAWTYQVTEKGLLALAELDRLFAFLGIEEIEGGIESWKENNQQA